MTRTILLAAALAAAATLAVPAAAQVAPGANAAIAHFNADREVGERLVLRSERARTVRPSASFGVAIGIRNASEDTVGERQTGLGTVVAGGGHSARAAAIFERLRLEDLENQ